MFTSKAYANLEKEFYELFRFLCDRHRKECNSLTPNFITCQYDEFQRNDHNQTRQNVTIFLGRSQHVWVYLGMTVCHGTEGRLD